MCHEQRARVQVCCTGCWHTIFLLYLCLFSLFGAVLFAGASIWHTGWPNRRQARRSSGEVIIRTAVTCSRRSRSSSSAACIRMAAGIQARSSPARSDPVCAQCSCRARFFRCVRNAGRSRNVGRLTLPPSFANNLIERVQPISANFSSGVRVNEIRH